jgi:hypothetical protein
VQDALVAAQPCPPPLPPAPLAHLRAEWVLGHQGTLVLAASPAGAPLCLGHYIPPPPCENPSHRTYRVVNGTSVPTCDNFLGELQETSGLSIGACNSTRAVLQRQVWSCLDSTDCAGPSRIQAAGNPGCERLPNFQAPPAGVPIACCLTYLPRDGGAFGLNQCGNMPGENGTGSGQQHFRFVPMGGGGQDGPRRFTMQLAASLPQGAQCLAARPPGYAMPQTLQTYQNWSLSSRSELKSDDGAGARLCSVHLLLLLPRIAVSQGLFPEANNGYDLWLFREQSSWFMYYISGSTSSSGSGDPPPTPAQQKGGNWNHIGASTSADGVHFAPMGPVLNVPANETEHIDWLGSGAVWLLLEPSTGGRSNASPKKKRWVINYSGAFSKNDTWDGAIDYQRIYFATSENLISWTPQPDATFSIDSRWYNDTECCIMRWDCMSVVCKDSGRSPGECQSGYHGLFTASPLPACPTCPDNKDGLGFASSADGLHWEALRPITQGQPGSRWPKAPPIGGEVGSVSRVNTTVFVLIGGRLWSAPSVEGPFEPMVNNPLILNGPINPETSNSDCTNGACWSFPRLWDLSTADESLMLMTVNRLVGGHTSYSDALKQARVDSNGTLRLMYWAGNDAMRGRPLRTSDDAVLSLFALPEWDLSAGLVLTAQSDAGGECAGVFVENGTNSGWVGCWHRGRGVGLIGGAVLNHSSPGGRASFRWAWPPTAVDRGALPIDASGSLRLRLLARVAAGSVGVPFRRGGYRPGTHAMLDLYVDDYLLAVWTITNMTGRVGMVGNGGAVSSCANERCNVHALSFRDEGSLPELKVAKTDDDDSAASLVVDWPLLQPSAPAVESKLTLRVAAVHSSSHLQWMSFFDGGMPCETMASWINLLHSEDVSFAATTWVKCHVPSLVTLTVNGTSGQDPAVQFGQGASLLCSTSCDTCGHDSYHLCDGWQDQLASLSKLLKPHLASGAVAGIFVGVSPAANRSVLVTAATHRHVRAG